MKILQLLALGWAGAGGGMVMRALQEIAAWDQGCLARACMYVGVAFIFVSLACLNLAAAERERRR